MLPANKINRYFSKILSFLVQDWDNNTDFDYKDFVKSGKPVVHVIGHNSCNSWIVTPAIIVQEAINAGGGDRIGMGIFHKSMWKFPGMSLVMKRYGGDFTNLEGYVDALNKRTATDLFVFPEGENCLFGNAVDIQEFKSLRFIEIALKTNSQIILHAVIGPEKWVHVLEPSKLLFPLIRYIPFNIGNQIVRTGRFTVPLFLTRIKKLRMMSRKYKLAIKKKDLGRGIRKSDQKRRLLIEGEKIRGELQKMVNELKLMGGS